MRNFVNIGVEQQGPDSLGNRGQPVPEAGAWRISSIVTLEWYFARVGSLTFDAFYKNIHNFFYQQHQSRTITNNGVTENIDIRGPANFDGNGKVKGFEVAYQQTFDFLPSFLSGLGISANYTYIHSRGLPNSTAQRRSARSTIRRSG